MPLNMTEDAVFLPGKVHGCKHNVYIIFLNEVSNNGLGSWEIQIVDAERIIKLYNIVKGSPEDFFALLPDMFQGEFEYCNFGTERFKELKEAYPSADFILGRDGNLQDELNFLLQWATKTLSES